MSYRRSIYFTITGDEEQKKLLAQELLSLCNEKGEFRSCDFVPEIQKFNMRDCTLSTSSEVSQGNKQTALYLHMENYGSYDNILLAQYIHKKYKGLRAYFKYWNNEMFYVAQYVKTKKNNPFRWEVNYGFEYGEILFAGNFKTMGQQLSREHNHKPFRTKRELMKFIHKHNRKTNHYCSECIKKYGEDDWFYDLTEKENRKCTTITFKETTFFTDKDIDDFTQESIQA